MGQEARLRASAAGSQLELLAEQLEGADEVSDERIAALAARAEELADLRSRVRTEQEALATLAAAVEAAEATHAELGRQLAALAMLVVPDAVVSLGDDLTDAGQALGEATRVAEAARIARTDAQEAAKHGPDAKACERALERIDERTRLAASIEKLEQGEASAKEAIDAAERGLASAREVAAETDRRLEQARLAAGAVGLRSSLIVGQPCPVCEQVVDEIPAHDLDAELEQAERAAATARDHAQTCQVAQATAAQEHADARAARSAAAERVRELDEQLADTADEATLSAGLVEAEGLAAALAEATTAADAGDQAERGARQALEELRETERSLRLDYSTARDAVSAARTPPVAGHESLRQDWDELADWARTTNVEVEAERVGAGRTLKETTADRNAKQQHLAELCAPHVEGEPPADLLDHVSGLHLQAVTDLGSARTRREQLDQAREKAAELRTEQQVARKLGELLKASGFERWLMEEAIADLAERASERLFELSNGQYSLVAEETDFRIRDHRNADEVRDARTLSGGETFLASLSLALALADSLTELAPEDSPRLESIFLDEGFGTLDPETLDVVAAAIEELGASGRMVGLVTHIRELADRMPVRFEVTKGPRTSSVERIEV